MSDDELVQGTLAGDIQAFKTLESKYSAIIKGYLYNQFNITDQQDIDDAYQDIIVKIHGALNNYDPTKSKFNSWVLSIAKFYYLDQIRKRKLDTVSMSGTDRPGGSEDTGEDKHLSNKDDSKLPIENMVDDENTEEIDRAIGRLPENYKKAILLRFYQDKTMQEIADTLQVPLNTAKVWLHRAKYELSTMLSKDLLR